MGKIKSEIPRGHFVFRNAPNAKGEHALNLQYVCNGVPVYKSTGIFLHPDMWNAATQEVRAKCPDATRINRRLKEFRNSIDEQIQNCDEVITVEVLRSIIKGTYGQTGKDTPFIQYAVKLNGKVRDTCLKSNNRNFQTSLRTIGKKLGLPFNLTMHVALHSFAVQALNNGMDVHVISTLLGHTSITATEKVYAKFLNKTLDQALIDKMPFSFSVQIDE